MFRRNHRKIPKPFTKAEDVSPFQYKKPKRSLKRWFLNLNKWQKALVILGVFVMTIGIILGIKTILATRRTFTSGGGAPALSCKISPACLRKEGDGRINVLLLGVGGGNHPGGMLSDTIMIVSIDPVTKHAAALSIPRDFYVPIGDVQKFGHAKVNSAHSYGETQKYPGGGPALAKETVENILDLPIHYYVRADFYGFKKAIDAVGGIDVTVDKALYDPFYPDDSLTFNTVLNIPAGRQHMNGDLALKYTRSRKTTSDFDRAARQQKVLIALREKALSIGTLTNPKRVAALIDTVGSHVRTDVSFTDLKDIIQIVKEVDPNAVDQKVLDTSPDNVLIFGGIAGGMIPKAGFDNFIDVRILAHTIFPDNYLKTEAAGVEIQNGTFIAGYATNVTKLLKGYGYNVVKTTTAKRQNYVASEIIDYSSGGKPFTLNYLERRFGVKAKKAKKPEGQAADFVVIVGSSYKL